jgi:iron(III) transport system ATP-binding protein
MLFAATADADGTVQLGPLRLPARRPVRPGAVKVAVRPEAWAVCDSAPDALPGSLLKCAYLGSFQELTVGTAIGEIFVVSPDVQRDWRIGEALALRLAGNGVSVVEAG